jgi:Uma2 family endonuclease
MSTVTAIRKPKQHVEIDLFALRRFSVADYHKMIDVGILKPDDRVELLEGWVVNKMPQNPPHSNSITRANRRLARILSDRWTLRVQAPITLSDSEPEPDIVLARGAEEIYDHRHPRPADIGVLMEFADSTLMEDRLYKSVLYAQERIAEFWIINLVARQIEVYTKPRGGKYQKNIEYTEKESVPLVLDGVKIADIPVTELLAKP